MRSLAWVTLVFVLVACGSDPVPHATNSTSIDFKLPTETPTPTATATLTPTPIPPTATPVPPTPKPLPKQAPAQVQATSGGMVYVEQCQQFFTSTVAQWVTLVAQYAWNLCSALRIINCESGGQADIWNSGGSGACGLWQHLPCQNNGDPVGSTSLAWAKYAARGWQPWEQCA